ncbi:MAG: DUF1570 domain-containing protein [Pirellula sp.]
MHSLVHSAILILRHAGLVALRDNRGAALALTASATGLACVAGCIQHAQTIESSPNGIVAEQAASSESPGGRLISTGAIDSARPTNDIHSSPMEHLERITDPKDASARPERTMDSSDRRPPILAVEMHDYTEYGVPIGLFSDKTLLMRRDGSIQFLPNARIVRQRILSDRFESMERNEMAQELYNEFGRRYAIKFEAPYLVIANSHHIHAWSQRFRSLFHSFRLYCKTHGLALREIEFPLVAIVLESHREFLHYAAADGSTLPANCVGYYSQKSNRIVLYESPHGIDQDTLETICHEATHQLAFNAGLHQRLAGTPLWVAEGFATMFESSKLSGLQSREGGSYWPESRRDDWKTLTKNPEGMYRLIDSLIRNDSAFDRDALHAYCGSWALTAYLSQRRAAQFGQYLNRVASMPPFMKYDTAQRVADFNALFGKDTRLMAKSVIAFIESLD